MNMVMSKDGVFHFKKIIVYTVPVHDMSTIKVSSVTISLTNLLHTKLKG